MADTIASDTGRFLHSPGHDCICKSVRSGQYCMVDTIASDTVPGEWFDILLYEASIVDCTQRQEVINVSLIMPYFIG